MDRRLEPALNLDSLFKSLPGIPGAEQAFRAGMERFLREQGPKLQRLASIGGDNAPFEQPDESEFADPQRFVVTSEETLREGRASSRWRWIADLARERRRVWIWAGPGAVDRWWSDGDVLPWGFHTPGLLDVIGSNLIGAIARWAAFEGELAAQLVAALLERIAEQSKGRPATGILALIVALLQALSAAPAFIDRQVATITRRVLAPGGQTARFAPLT